MPEHEPRHDDEPSDPGNSRGEQSDDDPTDDDPTDDDPTDDGGGTDDDGGERPRWRRSRVILVVVALFAVAGGVVAVSAATDSDGVESLAAAEEATVRIAAEREFALPADFSDFASFGSGTGFVVDESGLAVTNNHVVAAGGPLSVHVSGEERPRAARVLGRSECHDLAVIDVEGEGFPVIEWSEVEIRNGLDVYAAGYPQDGGEYSTARGIVSNADTDAETDRASVDRMIAHDAGLRAGNTGGPLLTADGEAIGVNHGAGAGGALGAAVHRDVVRDLIGRLADGRNVASIGINPQAVVSDDGSLSGVWVAGVVADSPAARAGVQAGDIITRLGGETMATTGTLAEYCDVLRRHEREAEPGDPLAVQVLRFGNGRVFEGQINGDELTRALSFRLQFAELVTAPSDDAETTELRFETVADRSETLRADVPTQWDDVSGAPLVTPEGQELPQIKVAPSIEEFDSSYSAPGVALILVPNSGEGDVPTVLDAFAGEIEGDCQNRRRSAYRNRGYTGSFDVYRNCAETGNAAFVIAALHPRQRFVVVVAANIVSRSDLAALDAAVDTFRVDR